MFNLYPGQGLGKESPSSLLAWGLGIVTGVKAFIRIKVRAAKGYISTLIRTRKEE